jgi:dolichyl-phosphate beta-glucosyltransferase
MPQVSVVIPARNEEQRIGPTLERVLSYLGRQSYSAEVVVVDDVSTDGTGRVVSRFLGREVPVALMRRSGKNGKGLAVRDGMLAATGERRLFSDADLSTPIEEAQKLLSALDRGYDVAIGSRMAPGAQVQRPLMRGAMSRAFNLLVQAFVLPGIRDSQCGFKALTRGATQDLFPRLTLTGWSFDAELLFLARKRGWRICEMPVRWIHSPATRMRPLRNALQMVRDLVRVRWQYATGAYQRPGGR